MARENIIILCYWNGSVTSSSSGIGYEGATPKPIRVSSRVSYKDLVDKLYSITGFDRLRTRIKITYRYPRNPQDYIPLP
ncbi:hypothetical protein OROHE_009266 [Orobanche hederae]